MSAEYKVMDTKLRIRGVIKLPQSVIEESGLDKGSSMKVIYGKNYTGVFIVPSNIVLDGRMSERVAILVNEKITS
jgi:hypothetical protein